jgi:hypothetical protein
MNEHIRYYHEDRTHIGLTKGAPACRKAEKNLGVGRKDIASLAFGQPGLGQDSLCFTVSKSSASSAQQVENEHDQCNYQQQVNQPATNVKAETQEPQELSRAYVLPFPAIADTPICLE